MTAFLADPDGTSPQVEIMQQSAPEAANGH